MSSVEVHVIVAGLLGKTGVDGVEQGRGVLVAARLEVAGVLLVHGALHKFAVGGAAGDEVEQRNGLHIVHRDHQVGGLSEPKRGQFIGHFGIAGLQPEELFEQGHGLAVVADALVDFELLVEQARGVALPLAGLAQIVEGVAHIAADHGGVEHEVEGFGRLAALIEAAVGHIGVGSHGVGGRRFAQPAHHGGQAGVGMRPEMGGQKLKGLGVAVKAGQNADTLLGQRGVAGRRLKAFAHGGEGLFGESSLQL